MVEHVAWVPCGFDREQSGIILTWKKVKVNMDSFSWEVSSDSKPSDNISPIIKDTIIPMVIENTSESLNLDLTPISGHPITAITTWPVAVLAVRHVVLFQLVLHLLLDLDDLPGCKDSSYGIIWDHMRSNGIIWDRMG